MLEGELEACIGSEWRRGRGIPKFESHGGLFVPGRSACPCVVPLHCPGAAWAAVSFDSRVRRVEQYDRSDQPPPQATEASS